MTDVLSRNLPAPRNWQDFERLTFDVFRRVWKSNDVELHGRTGQPQNGVDVFGTDYTTGSGGGRFTGVQCKGKDADYRGVVTEKELRAEIEKALGFQPPLEVFILATTAPNDAKIQAVARAITKEHRAAGKFEVQVKGWETFCQLMSDHTDVVSKHFPDLAPYDLIGKVDEGTTATGQGIQQVLTVLHQHGRILSDMSDKGAESDSLATSVNEIAAQIGFGSPLVALKSLERMRKENEGTASKLAQFRMLANIGNAHLALGGEIEAIAAFTQAHAVYPEYPNARATLAVAKTLQGERDEALALAKTAIADDPTSRRAAGVILDMMPQGTPMAEVIAALPADILQHFEIKIGLSLRAHREGDSASALRFAEEANALKPDDWRTLSGLAEALLSPIATQDVIAVTGLLDKELAATFDRAIELNKRAWKILAAQDSSYQGRHVAANLVSQLLLAGDDAGAWEVLDQALVHNPDYAPLLQRKAQRAAGQGDWERARDAVAAIPLGVRIFEDAMMLVQCALRLKDSNAAQAMIPELTTLAQLPEQAEFAAALAAEVDILGGADPTVSIEAALDAQPHSLILRSALLDIEGKDESLKRRIIDEISALASDEMTPRARVMAAEAMIDAREFSKAADLYEPLHNQRESSTLFRRLQTLHWADRRKEARSLFESLPASARRKEKHVRLGILIYEHAGLLKPAVKLLEDSMAIHDRLVDRIRWMQLLIRLGETRHIEWLRRVSPDIEGSARELTMLAQFVDKYLAGDAKALDLGYRALRAGYSDPQVHLGFAFGLFFQGSARRGELKPPARIEPGCGVILVDDASGEVLHYIIEPGENPAGERGEIAPDNVVAKDLLGRAVGDVISIRKIAPTNQTYRIAEVQNGYVFAFQRTLRDFNRMFPGHPAFGSIQIDESKEPSERFEPMFALARERSEQARNLEEFYESGPMPLFMLARFSGSNLFDIWEALRVRPDKYLKVAQGLGPEFAMGAAAARSGIVLLDPLTIYAWVRLGLAETMLKFRGNLGIVQSSIDLLRQLHAEREDQRGQTFGSMGWDGERYHMIEATQEEIERRIADASAAAEFADRLVLVPAESHRRLPPDVSGLLADAHPAFSDTLLAGLQDKRAVLTDDFGLRVIAQECGISCTWTQTFMQEQVRAGDLLPAEYQAGLDALITSHYDFTQIGPAEILAELRQSNWLITDKLRRYAALMVRPNVDRASLANLMSQLAIESRFSQASPSELAAFHILFVEALTEVGSAADAQPVYRLALLRMKMAFLNWLMQREYRRSLLGSTTAIKPATLVAEFEERALALTRETWEMLAEGGLVLPASNI